MKLLFVAAAATALLATAPSFAQECTEDIRESKSKELFALLEEKPGRGENLEKHVAAVEAEYGGEPSEAQTCEALDKLMEKVRADG